MARLNYLELPVGDLAAAKAFYAAAFGWDFTDFGPSYASTMSGDTD
ncbi:VOC family protein, partial [Pseudomonas sp. EA_15y_Pfl1_P102]